MHALKTIPERLPTLWRVIFAIIALALATASLAAAGLPPPEIAMIVHSQNLVRHPNERDYQFVQQRTTLQTRLQWNRATDPTRLRLVKNVRLVLESRASYDSVYDYTPTFRERDLRGRRPSRVARRDLADLTPQARAAIRTELQLRQAYVDLELRRLPLRFRLGRQQVVWGEADFFRMLDRANPLDISWHGAQELPPPAFGWDDLRIPLWMARAWWIIGTAGPITDIALEAYWNPGDWRPARVSFLPRPWGIRLLHPLTNREDGAFHAPFTGIERLANGSELFRQGAYSRHPGENSQIGVQLTGQVGDLRMGIHYFYQRWAGDDGTPFAPIRGIVDDLPGRLRTQQLIARGTLPAEYITPHVHTIGISANYFDADWTLATLRVESVLDLDLPLFDRSKATTLAPLLPGVSTRDYWKAMVAMDRAVVPPGFNGSPIFFTWQAYVHHLIGSVRTLTGPLDLPTAGQRSRPFCGAEPPDPCDDPSGSGSFRDNVHRWEALLTFAALTFLRNGAVVPVVGIVLDPVNSYAMNLFWSLDYAWNKHVTLNVTQRFFTSAQDDIQKGPFDPWNIGTQRGRSETGLRISYAL